MEKMKTTLETLTVPFRFLLPAMVSLLLYDYHNDQIQLHGDISNIKASQEKIWEAVGSASKRNDGKFDYVFQQCCGQARMAPPA